MELGCVNVVVKDAEAALRTYLKLFGTNNIEQVIRLEGLDDGMDVVDGYYLKTNPVNLAIFTPRTRRGRMGKYLVKEGGGIHHITLYLRQDDFEDMYVALKNEGFPVSPATYIGKFSEACFWVEEKGEQGVPVRFATKAHRGLKIWQETNYLDSPRRFWKVEIEPEYVRPRLSLGTVVLIAQEGERQQQAWAKILRRPAVPTGDIFTLEPGKVNDGRGNIFVPVRYQFLGGGGLNLYSVINEDAPIRRRMARRREKVVYHDAICYVTRDRIHSYWQQLEDDGFAMLDPKPLLNTNAGNGNYFFFVHPISTHGVLWEFVAAIKRDDSGRAQYDWTNTEIYLVPPEVS